MATTKKQSLKAFNATESKVMVTYEFEQPMYVKEAISLFARPTLTPNIDEAVVVVWGAMDTIVKLDYHKILTNAKELQFLSIK